MHRILQSSDKKYESCTFGPDMLENIEVFPWVFVSNYLPIFTFCLAMIVLGKNIEGSQLRMVYLITALMIVQSASVLILTTVFLCNSYLYYIEGEQPFNGFGFWYAITCQLADMQIYVNLIWLYSWYRAFEKVKLGDDLQSIENSAKADEAAV